MANIKTGLGSVGIHGLFDIDGTTLLYTIDTAVTLGEQGSILQENLVYAVDSAAANTDWDTFEILMNNKIDLSETTITLESGEIQTFDPNIPTNKRFLLAHIGSLTTDDAGLNPSYELTFAECVLSFTGTTASASKTPIQKQYSLVAIKPTATRTIAFAGLNTLWTGFVTLASNITITTADKGVRQFAPSD